VKALLIIVVLTLIFTGTTVYAQNELNLKVGDRLKIKTEAGKESIRILEADVESLTYTSKESERVTVKLSELTSLKVAYPRTRGRACWTRALAGGLAGGLVGVILGVTDPEETAGEEGSALFAAIMLGIGGTVAGGASGLIYPGTIWKDVELPVQIDLRARNAGRIGISYSYSF
jgi:hypothetical protein